MDLPITSSGVEAVSGQLDHGLGFLLRKAHRAFVRALARELAPHGVATAEWSVLRVLWHEEGLSQVDLAERMRVERSSLTSVLEGMEKRGLLQRLRDSADRRKVRLHLTQSGRALEPVLLPCGLVANERAVRGISPAKVAAANQLLEQLIANLED